MIIKEDRFWSLLIDYHLIIPKICELLKKTLKPEIPLTSIISGLDSVFHRKVFIQNTKHPFLVLLIIQMVNIFHKTNNINMKNKSFASLNINSLCINIHLIKCIKSLENHFKITKIKLPLPVNKIIKICTVYTKHSSSVQYNGIS